MFFGILSLCITCEKSRKFCFFPLVTFFIKLHYLFEVVMSSPRIFSISSHLPLAKNACHCQQHFFFVCVKILIHLLSTYRQVDLSAEQLIVDVTVEFDWNSNSWECKLPFQSILYFNRPRFLLIEKMQINFFNWSKFLSSDEFVRIHSNLNFSNFTFFGHIWSNSTILGQFWVKYQQFLLSRAEFGNPWKNRVSK